MMFEPKCKNACAPIKGHMFKYIHDLPLLYVAYFMYDTPYKVVAS